MARQVVHSGKLVNVGNAGEAGSVCEAGNYTAVPCNPCLQYTGLVVVPGQEGVALLHWTPPPRIVGSHIVG